jgi:hypothetical protein
MMDTRTKLEVAGGLVLAVILGLYGYEQFQKAVGVRVAETVAQHDREADAKLDAKLKLITDADSQRQKDYEQKTANVQKLTPQQIVVKLPEYVPQATQPVQVLTPQSPIVQSGQAHDGDALVPAADIKPIAQALVDGQKCSGDLGSCKTTVQTWQDKYAAKSDEAKQWQVAAKGGSVWKRVGKDILKIGVGVGIGYALKR